MKNQKVWDKSIRILVKSYLNDTLVHDSCAACAVGNLISGSCGYEVKSINDDDFWVDKKGNVLYPNWHNVFVSYRNSWVKRVLTGKKHGHNFKPENRDECINLWAKKTGYDLVELAQIEKAFETAPFGKSKSDYMFNGLMAVVDTLMQIHEASKEEAQQAKELFILTDAG